jgi:hypothetical protein
MGFQTSVNLQQAAAVAGDFASANPISTVVAHEGTLVAGTGGVTVARFAWADSGGNVTNAGTGAPTGFVGRAQGAALVTTYLAETGNLVPAGFPVTLIRSADLWCTITVSAAAIGKKAFASNTDGTMQPGTAGATISGYTETPFTITGFPVGGTGAVGELAVISNL